MRKFRQSPAHCRFPNRRTRNILGCADQISGTERLADGGDVAECRRQMIPFITTDEEKRHLPPGERCGYIIHRFAIHRSEEHTSELQSLMRISYAVFCLKKKMCHHTHKYTSHKTYHT